MIFSIYFVDLRMIFKGALLVTLIIVFQNCGSTDSLYGVSSDTAAASWKVEERAIEFTAESAELDPKTNLILSEGRLELADRPGVFDRDVEFFDDSNVLAMRSAGALQWENGSAHFSNCFTFCGWLFERFEKSGESTANLVESLPSFAVRVKLNLTAFRGKTFDLRKQSLVQYFPEVPKPGISSEMSRFKSLIYAMPLFITPKGGVGSDTLKGFVTYILGLGYDGATTVEGNRWFYGMYRVERSANEDMIAELALDRLDNLSGGQNPEVATGVAVLLQLRVRSLNSLSPTVEFELSGTSDPNERLLRTFYPMRSQILTDKHREAMRNELTAGGRLGVIGSSFLKSVEDPSAPTSGAFEDYRLGTIRRFNPGRNELNGAMSPIVHLKEGEYLESITEASGELLDPPIRLGGLRFDLLLNDRWATCDRTTQAWTYYPEVSFSFGSMMNLSEFDSCGGVLPVAEAISSFRVRVNFDSPDGGFSTPTFTSLKLRFKVHKR